MKRRREKEGKGEEDGVKKWGGGRRKGHSGDNCRGGGNDDNCKDGGNSCKGNTDINRSVLEKLI